MKAVQVQKKGELSLVEAPLKPAQGSIRVRVRYAGVGFADVMAARGGYLLAPSRPFSPGYEFMGTLESGQRVAGMLPVMGGYREVLDLDPRWVVSLPDGLGDETAAALPLNYLTAALLVGPNSRLSAGEGFVIHGAAGGVGTAVLELARGRGLRAFGTVSAGKEAVVEALGATALHRGRWREEAREREPQGFRAAFDSFGLESMRQSYASLAAGGTLVSYGFSPTLDGGNPALVDGMLFHARRKLFPSQGRRVALCRTPATIKADPAWYRATLSSLFEAAARGGLKPQVFDVLPWNQAERAHSLLAEGAVRGKLLLKFD